MKWAAGGGLLRPKSNVVELCSFAREQCRRGFRAVFQVVRVSRLTKVEAELEYESICYFPVVGGPTGIHPK